MLITRDIEWANLMLGFEQVIYFPYHYLFLVCLDADFGAHVYLLNTVYDTFRMPKHYSFIN